MTTPIRAALLLAGASQLFPAAAQAESADAIVVTGTKKSQAEDLQDVALAVNVFSGEALQERKVRAVSDLTHAIPGVSLDQVGTFRGVSNWSIRGLGINSSIASVDPAVGTFIDGVYLAINPGASLDTFDLKSVEVLRGPQGTLYGRNVTGGAVLVETADPSHDWHVAVRGAADGPVDSGRGDINMTMSAVVSGPIAEGLAFRLGAYHNSDGGYFRNRFNAGDYGKAETTVLRGGLLYEAGPLRLVGKLEYLKTSGDGVISQNHGLFPRDGFGLSVNNEGYIRARSWFGTLRADYDLAGGKLTNVFGWRKYRQFTDNDIDSTPQTLFHSKTGLTQEQWSDELRWAGSLGDSFDLTLGGYLFHQNVAYEEDRFFGTPALSYGGGRQKHDVYGLFAQGDWQLAPALTLTAGLRWSREKKDARVTFVQTRAACSVIAESCPIAGTNPVTGAPNGFADGHAWSNWSPKLGLSWQAADTVLAYASWSRAYRSGGYNLRITQPAQFLANAAAAGTPAYREERVDSAEIGVKLRTADARGTLNLAAYRTWVQDMQREVSVASTSSGLAQSIYNTADARIQGGEIEASYSPMPSLTLSANLGYIDADYTEVFYNISADPANLVNAADLALKLPRVPKWTYGVSLRHELPLGGASALVTRISFQHRSRYAYTDSNFGWVGASDNLDADLTWKLPIAGWSLSIYGRNLLDQVQFGGDTQIPFGGPLSDGNNRPFDPRSAAGTLSPLVKGRTLGVEVAAEF